MTAAAAGRAASRTSAANSVDAAEIGREPGRQGRRIRIQAEAEDRAGARGSRREPLEVGPACRRGLGRGAPVGRGSERRVAGQGHGAVDADADGPVSPGAALPGWLGPAEGAGSSDGGTNHDGRDAPSRPETVVRSVVFDTAHWPLEASSVASFRSTIWPARWRNAIASPGGRPDRRERVRIVRDLEDLLAPAVEDHDVRPERVAPGRGHEPPVRRVRRGEVAGTRERRGLLRRRVVAVQLRGALRAVAPVPDVEQAPCRRSATPGPGDRASRTPAGSGTSSFRLARSNRFRTTSLWSGFGASVATMTDLPSGDGVGSRIQANQVLPPCWNRPVARRSARAAVRLHPHERGRLEVVPGPLPAAVRGELAAALGDPDEVDPLAVAENAGIESAPELVSCFTSVPVWSQMLPALA